MGLAVLAVASIYPLMVRTEDAVVMTVFLASPVAILTMAFGIPAAYKTHKLLQEASSECKRCFRSTIVFVKRDTKVHAVRSVERLVANKVTGVNESRSVVVTDHQITDHYKCSSCGYKWESWFIRTIE